MQQPYVEREAALRAAGCSAVSPIAEATTPPPVPQEVLLPQPVYEEWQGIETRSHALTEPDPRPGWAEHCSELEELAARAEARKVEMILARRGMEERADAMMGGTPERTDDGFLQDEEAIAEVEQEIQREIATPLRRKLAMVRVGSQAVTQQWHTRRE